MPSTRSVRDQGFGGLDTDSAQNRMGPYSAQEATNTDHKRPFMLRVRAGLARTTLSKLEFPARELHYFIGRDGVARLLIHIPGDGNEAGNTHENGKLEGEDLPTPVWQAEPKVRTGGSWVFPPVTLLTISDYSGITLTWANPVSPHWVGTKVVRRTDAYPQGPNDPAATTVYDGRLETCTDAALATGDTGYYVAYAYSATRWSAPSRVNGVKVVYGVWGGSNTDVSWHA